MNNKKTGYAFAIPVCLAVLAAVCPGDIRREAPVVIPEVDESRWAEYSRISGVLGEEGTAG